MTRHAPSAAYLDLIAAAGGITAASKLYAIPESTLYCYANGWRRLGRPTAEKLEAGSAGRWLAADLLGLTRSPREDA